MEFAEKGGTDSAAEWQRDSPRRLTVVHNNRRNLKRAQAVVIGKNVSPSGRTSTARASDAKTDYIILFSIGGVTRSLFAGQALYTDLQVGDHGTLSYRDGRVVGFTRAA